MCADTARVEGTSGPSTKQTWPALGRARRDSSCAGGFLGNIGISCSFSPELHSAKAPPQHEPESRVNLQTR